MTNSKKIVGALLTTRKDLYNKFGRPNGLHFGTLLVWEFSVGKYTVGISYLPKVKNDNASASFPIWCETKSNEPVNISNLTRCLNSFIKKAKYEKINDKEQHSKKWDDTFSTYILIYKNHRIKIC